MTTSEKILSPKETPSHLLDAIAEMGFTYDPGDLVWRNGAERGLVYEARGFVFLPVEEN